MNQPTHYKPSPRYYCSIQKADTPHYIRANGETAVCLSCFRGEDRPVKQLVKALPGNRGGPERHLG